ncbi:MAG: hypothetical protein NNA30_00845 [Nitrospira sp.]|nr:hypothetical protein [Nitrospira sp.]
MKSLLLRFSRRSSTRRSSGLIANGSLFLVIAVIGLLTGCASTNRYALIEQSLLAGDPVQAASIVERAESEYGSKSRLLYLMDRGMALHLAGDYAQSNEALEQAEEIVERLYTRTIRSETLAFLTNDNALPYEGDPYEHVMVNVVKALNYAAQNDIAGALVEARRIDHRLNVLSDRLKGKGKNGYGNDGFARYLSGMLYEAAGDLNNAFIAYRNACEAYEAMRGWSQVACPPSLRADLLSSAEALGLADEVDRYRSTYPDVEWLSASARQRLAQVVMISYNGRAPRKEDLYLDLPISLDALQLVLLNRGFSPSFGSRDRVMDSVLYGLSGRVVRVALPRLIHQKTKIPVETMTLTDEQGASYATRSERVQDLTALAEKTLTERLPAMTVKAVARAATKFSMAEGAVIGSQQAVGRDAAPWVGLLVSLLAKGLAVASEEADKRSWRTLPDEIHVARVWVPSGRYRATVHPSGGGVAVWASEAKEPSLNLSPGQTIFLFRRVVQ